MVKKRDPNHDRTRAPIIKGECGSSSQGFKPTCVGIGRITLGSV